MHKSRLGAVIVDCQTEDLFEAAGFWSAALGAKTEQAGEQANPKYIRMEGSHGGVRVILQKVGHPSRVHLDIESDDIEAEVNRLLDAGATVVDRLERWVVMEAPSGHRFCIISPSGEDFDEKANVWP